MTDTVESHESVLAEMLADMSTYSEAMPLAVLVEWVNRLAAAHAREEKEAARYRFLRLRMIPEEITDTESCVLAVRACGPVVTRPADDDAEECAAFDAAIDAHLSGKGEGGIGS